MSRTLESTKNLLEHLVAMPVFGGQSNLPIANFIETFLEDRQIFCTRVENKEEKKRALHCRIGPPIDGGVILSGHMDVVPIEGQPWHMDPFRLTQVATKLYGRGSCDMKGFIACCLASLDLMKKAKLKKPIYFAFSYDEEVGCLAGPALAQSILETYSEKPGFAIIGEPTGMQTVTAEKGMAIFETSISSAAGHSSQIRSGVSAIREAARLIKWFDDKMESLIANQQTDSRFDPPHTTLHSGIIQGGVAPNIIADQCTFKWDLRSLPSDNLAEILQDFTEFCQHRTKINQEKVPGFKITTNPLFPPVPPLDTPSDASIVSLMHHISTNHQLGAVSYGSEAGQFAEKGFETIICGPGSINQAHKANEYIEIKQLENCLRFLKRFAIHLST